MATTSRNPLARLWRLLTEDAPPTRVCPVCRLVHAPYDVAAPASEYCIPHRAEECERQRREVEFRDWVAANEAAVRRLMEDEVAKRAAEAVAQAALSQRDLGNTWHGDVSWSEQQRMNELRAQQNMAYQREFQHDKN